MLFLKLGGSLITDKTGVEVVRPDVLTRLADEIAAARRQNPGLRLLIGHGGGSFGHVAATKYDTRQGVRTAVQWRGFAAVQDAMARLNRLVVTALLAADVPAMSFQTSAFTLCADGRISQMSPHPIQAALDAGLVPVIHGDAVFDSGRGGTIVSTEEVMAALTAVLRPSWLLLAGGAAGVLDSEGVLIPAVTLADFPRIEAALGGSHGADVTGGMDSKVRSMLALTEKFPRLQVRIFSGLDVDAVKQVLLRPETAVGTMIGSC